MTARICGFALLFFSLAVGAALPSYEISLSVDFEAGTFAGTERVAYTDRTPDRLNEVVFRLLPNGGGIYGDASLEVESVTIDGRPVDADLTAGGTALRVRLPSPIEPGGAVTIELEFNGRAAGPPEGGRAGYGVLTKSETSFTLSAFYPILAVYGEGGWDLPPVPTFGDALSADYAAYDVTVMTDPGLGVAGTGKPVEEKGWDDRVRYRFTTSGARDFTIAILKGYEVEEDRSGDLTIRSWFSPSDSDAARIARRVAIEAAAFYEGVIGDLPMSEIDLVEVPLHEAAGVESSGMILISSGYAERPEDPFYEIIVSHEVAHQWFYDTVGNDVIDHPWLDEGLASYLSYLFLEETRPSAAADQKSGWERSYGAARDRYRDLSVTDRVSDFPDVDSYTSYVYSGGALLFDAIRGKIGEPTFLTGLSDYYRENSGGIATPEDLIGAFERACTCSLERVFARFTGD